MEGTKMKDWKSRMAPEGTGCDLWRGSRIVSRDMENTEAYQEEMLTCAFFHFAEPRDPDHVLTQHAHIRDSDENPTGVRTTQIRQPTQDDRCAALQQSPGIPG